MSEKKDSRKRIGGFISDNLSFFLPAAGIVIFLAVSGIHCPIKYLTGLSCPGCGMTRAVFSVLRLDFSSAFYFHALWPLVAVIGVCLVFNYQIPTKWKNPVLWLVSACFIIYYLYRLFRGDGTIVAFEPQKGLIYKVVNYLISVFGR